MESVEARIVAHITERRARFNEIAREAGEIQREVAILEAFLPKPAPTATATATQPATTIDGRNMSLPCVIMAIMGNPLNAGKPMGVSELVPLIKASGYHLHSKQQVYCALSDLTNSGKLKRVQPGAYRRKG
jgi:hypothetical protein